LDQLAYALFEDFADDEVHLAPGCGEIVRDLTLKQATVATTQFEEYGVLQAGAQVSCGDMRHRGGESRIYWIDLPRIRRSCTLGLFEDSDRENHIWVLEVIEQCEESFSRDTHSP